MRLLIVGSDKVHAIENIFAHYLSQMDVPVSIYPATSIFYDYYYKNLINKIKYRLGISSILREINASFKTHVESLKPDIVWVFKGMEIFPETLKWAKKAGIRLVNYNPDNPFIFTGRGSGNSNISKSLLLYDLYFTYSLEIKQQLEQRVAGKVTLLPFAFDIPERTFAIASQETEIKRLCFVGNPDKQRANFIIQLAKLGIPIDIYGNHWGKFVEHASVSLFPPVFNDELWKVLRRYRIQLNMMRVHNTNSHNMRSFEVPAIGGILLAPDTPDHRFFFEEGREVFLYKDLEECKKKIDWLFALSGTDANHIRNNARKKSIEMGYGYEDRTRQVVEEMKFLNA